ncbi:MAG: hypothetical protein GOU98_02365 [Candidatus Altiarchaeota archaeon]|nr:hypothetical protein [Candidatus Altiarchaeota archaeon]
MSKGGELPYSVEFSKDSKIEIVKKNSDIVYFENVKIPENSVFKSVSESKNNVRFEKDTPAYQLLVGPESQDGKQYAILLMFDEVYKSLQENLVHITTSFLKNLTVFGRKMDSLSAAYVFTSDSLGSNDFEKHLLENHLRDLIETGSYHDVGVSEKFIHLPVRIIDTPADFKEKYASGSIWNYI